MGYKKLPESIYRYPAVIKYHSEYKLIYIEFNTYNANESLRIRKVYPEWQESRETTIYYVTIDKERYDVTELVHKAVSV